jgi:hypothetical protein
MSSEPSSIIANPDILKKSYTLLFAEQIPEVLFYQRDRPHYYNLLLKLIALCILLAVMVPLTLLPIYPFLSVFLANNFSVSNSFSGGAGKMNLYWIGLMYIFYIFHMGNTVSGTTNGTSSVTDNTGSGIYLASFMGLTPIALLLTWYYAMPVTIHDGFIDIYNNIYETHPLLAGGIPYSSMKCPSDVQTRLMNSRGSSMSGSGDSFQILGMGFTELIIAGLIGVVLSLVVVYIWSSRLDTLSELNANTPSHKMNTVYIQSR